MLSKLPYGLKNGKLIPIKKALQGLNCNCVCPECGSRLIARKGDNYIHHFAHYKESNCKGGLETALHLVAKDIIEKEKQLVLPPLKTSIGKKVIVLTKSCKVAFEQISVEVCIANIKPDLIAELKGKRILIEIAVTHFVDEVKREKIKELGFSAIEINLSKLKDGFTHDELRKQVIYSTENKSWIYNKREAELIEKYLQIEQEKHWDLKQKLLEQRKIEEQKTKKLRQAGCDIIVPDSDGNLLCPMKIHQKAQQCKKSKIILQIQSGQSWNGSIYGKGHNGNYIYINGVKIEIFPSKKTSLTKTEYQNRNKLYGQLSYIKKQAISDYGTCEACMYFGEYIEKHFTSFACKYRKNNNLAK